MLNTRRQHAIYLSVINASIDKFPLSTHCPGWPKRPAITHKNTPTPAGNGKLMTAICKTNVSAMFGRGLSLFRDFPSRDSRFPQILVQSSQGWNQYWVVVIHCHCAATRTCPSPSWPTFFNCLAQKFKSQTAVLCAAASVFLPSFLLLLRPHSRRFAPCSDMQMKNSAMCYSCSRPKFDSLQSWKIAILSNNRNGNNKNHYTKNKPSG